MFSGYNVSLCGEKNKLIATLFWFRIFIFSGKHLFSHMLINHYLLNCIKYVFLSVFRCFPFLLQSVNRFVFGVVGLVFVEWKV